MKKILLTFALIGCAASINATQVTDVLTQSKIGNEGTTYKEYTYKGESGAEYALQCAGDKGSIQMRSANSNSGIVVTKSPGKIVSVAVEWNDGTAAGRTLNIYGYDTEISTPSGLYGSSAPAVAGTIVNGSSTEFYFSGDFPYVGMRSNASAMYLNSISITWDLGDDDDTLTPASLSFPETGYTIALGEEFSAPVVTVDPEAAASEVVYASSNEKVATVDAKTGAVTVLYPGNTTISASITDSETYKNVRASYTLNVTTGLINVAKTIEYINDGYTGTAITKGIVVKVDSFNETYGSITYWISDDGTETNMMQVYGGLNFGGTKFESIESIKVGASVVVEGSVKLYGTTPEFDLNSVLLEYNGEGGGDDTPDTPDTPDQPGDSAKLEWNAAESYANSLKTLEAAGWTASYVGNNDTPYTGFDSSDDHKGMQFGSSSNSVNALTITSTEESAFYGETLSSVVVNASTAKDAKANIKVEVDGEAYGEEQTLTNNVANYTFKGSAKAGIVTITISQPETKKALYLGGITVNYDTTVAVDSILTDVDAAPVYYNLQGVRVNNPEKGLYIVVKGNKSQKVLF